MPIVDKHWEADGSAVNVGLGFNPDWMMALANTGGTNPNIYFWFRRMQDDQSMYGLLLTGSSGEVTRLTTAATGISTFNTGYNQVLVDSPVPGKGKVKADVSDWAAATDYSSGARSATAIGTIVRPPTHNGRVYELTTATSTGTSAPSSWPTALGATATDGGSNVWTCREEQIVRGGAQGVTLGVTTQTDGHEWFLLAGKSDVSEDAGDAAEHAANDVI